MPVAELTGPHVHRGHIFHIAGSPTLAGSRDALVSIPAGALVVAADGSLAWTGSYRDLPAEFAAADVRGSPSDILLPGFVDTHLHFPQTFSTDSYGGGQLLEWLENSIFPAESRLADPDFAASVAREFTRRRIAAGTTSALVFGSAFPHAQDSLFEESERAGLRTVSGRGIQTVGSERASPLITGEVEALDLVAAEIDRWHAVDTGDPATALLQVAVVPRFSLSVTPHTLGALGDLYDSVRSRGVYFHSHLSENDRPGTGEIDVVKSVYHVGQYLHTYDGRFLPGSQVGGHSMLGRRSILAHAVHCADEELARLAETETSISHCPTSQLFLGSGTMPWQHVTAFGVNVAIGSDIAGGDEWLIPRVLNDCFKVHISELGAAGLSIDPAQLLFTGTLAGARALDMEPRYGNFDVGKDADFIVVDPDRWQPLASILDNAVLADDESLRARQLLFAVLLGMREPAIAAVYVRGRRISLPE